MKKDMLRDHTRKKKHHQGKLSGKIDPYCVLKDKTINQREQNTSKGHTAQLREF